MTSEPTDFARFELQSQFMKLMSLKSTALCCAIFSSLFITALPSDSSKAQPKRSPYRASVTRQNDLIHTRLDVKFDWFRSQMTGKATITGKPFNKPTSKLVLDARGLEIQSVEVYNASSGRAQPNMKPNPELPGGGKLNSSFKYENDSLKINLGKEFTAEEKYLVKINYTAKPEELKKGGSDAISDDKGLYFINPKGEKKDKMPQIWTQGETQASSAWFPTIDSPNEKMTTEIFMTVDGKYTTLSNGILTESKKNPDNTRTDHWKMELPHSPYLVMMAVGEFKKVTDLPWNGKEISYYVEKEYEPHAKAIFGNTREMIDFYSKILGTPYPWAKYSQIVVRDYVSGAMENTSATLHGDFMVYQTPREMIDGKKGEDVIAHELFHQWFGDLVTAESWSNLPLNESFATYGEYLWQEYKEGREAADAHSYQSRMGYFQAAREKQVPMIRFEYESKEDMFDAWSYNKGGQILHMLRKYTGDKVFFASLKLYLERNRFKNAEMHDLRLAFEEVSGEDLNWFFNEWFFTKGHPELLITKSYDPKSSILKLKVRQEQKLSETPLYTLPVDVDIYAGGKKERTRILIDQQEQEFSFSVSSHPDLVNFDAERQLLGLKTYTKSTEELIFQYKNAPLFLDRHEALSNLKTEQDKENVYKLFLTAAESDNWYELRMNAIQTLKKTASKKESELKPLLLKIAASDKNTNVRALAMSVLSENYKGEDLTDLYRKSANEQSYALLSSALKALATTDRGLALKKAKELEPEKNKRIFEAISVVYSKNDPDAHNYYFVNIKSSFSEYENLRFLYYYNSFLKECTRPETFVAASAIFADIIKTSNDYVKAETKKAYEEGILAFVKKKEEDLKKENTPSETIKEWENVRNKIEILYKTL